VRGRLGPPPSSIIFTQFNLYLRSFVNPVVAALLAFVLFVGSP